MTTQPTPQQPPAQPPEPLHWWNDQERILAGLAQSNYVTAFWDWCMMLLGKAAAPVLFVSVLYSGYELLPGVPQPGAVIDAPMFVTQQAALDIGGLGLMKMAKHARLAKDSFPYRVGVVLVVLMIVNVATASLEKVVHLPPVVSTVIEAVLAVLYGHAIHALKDEGVTLSHGQSRVQEQVEELALGMQQQGMQVQTRLEELAQEMQQHVQQLAERLTSVQENMQHRLQESRLRMHLASELASLQEQLALLQTGHLQIADLQTTTAHLQTAKQASASPATQAEQRNITSIDEARARHEANGQSRAKVSHTDVLAFLAANPDLKRVEIAERLGISERKVYDAIAWGKEQERGTASV